MTVCLPGAKIEDVTERVGQVMGNIRVHVGTNNADKFFTNSIGYSESRYRVSIDEIKYDKDLQL